MLDADRGSGDAVGRSVVRLGNCRNQIKVPS